jgi:hypothetical protein
MDTELDEPTGDFYRRAVQALREAGVPFLVGGAYATERYTGIARHTKDIDIFVRPADVRRTLDALAAAGYRTELTFPHWLGKAFHDDTFVDVIFNSANGLAAVDDEWFERAPDAVVLGEPVKLVPVEEALRTKAFVMERERFDGADVAHLLRGCPDCIDWPHLIRRFGPNWRVLLGHLVFFGFIYPSERQKVPAWVLTELTSRLRDEVAQPAPTERVCRGTLFSREQYLVDLNRWGYEDARLQPHGSLSAEDIKEWTEAIGTGR